MTVLQFPGPGYGMMAWWFDTFGPYGWILMVVGCLAFFSVSVTLAYRVHKDALQRRIPNPEFWLVFVLLLNIAGYILYRLVRKNYASVVHDVIRP
jgi:hypothetical protein